VQESLSNIGKHAHATQAWVTLDLSDLQTLTLTIRDNGRGFDSTPTPGQLRGFGLGNMAERIKSLGGQFILNSAPGQGTTICVQIPYNSQR
jgi:signal transduction histidine kinase